MSGLQPNSININRTGAGVFNSQSVVVHPEYRYYRSEWSKLRDVIAGQREVKNKRTTYLPLFKGMDADNYTAYLAAATFYNMTRQTLTGMVGQAFRKDPVIRGLPKTFADAVNVSFAKDGTGHIAFTKTVVGEQIALGRFGVLVDAPSAASVDPSPYVVGYTAENITDWTVETIKGRDVLTRVVLREFAREPGIYDNQAMAADGRRVAAQIKNSPAWRTLSGDFDNGYVYTTNYRELVLVPMPDGTRVYKQRIYSKGQQPNGGGYVEITPVIRGNPLGFIPFMFFGASSNIADVEQSPLLDIADLNISHYRTYAELEHGRKFTALPVYYCGGGQGEDADQYHVGPDVVWEVPEGVTPGILEFKGQGLGALERALSTKESQIAAIGGRLLPGGKQASESPGQTAMREANEQAVLLNVLAAAEVGMTIVVRWWMMFRDVPFAESANVFYEVNQDFISNPIGAREMRAVQLMYKDGILPIEVVFDFFQRAEVLPREMEIADFKKMLDNPTSFINNPDVQARQRGYTDRKQELEQAQLAREYDFQQQELDLQDRQVTLEEEAPPPAVKPPTAVGPNPPKATRPVQKPPGVNITIHNKK